MLPVMLIIIACVIGIVIKIEYDKTNSKKKLIVKLNRQWGDVPKDEFSQEKLNSLSTYYKAVQRESGDIDAITWNDLDMDQIFMTINSTCSAAGEEYLFALLHQPEFSEEKLLERNRLIEFFRTNKEKRLEVQTILAGMGKMRNISVYEYMNRLNNLPRENNATHYFLILSIVIAVGYIFVDPMIGFLLTAGTVINNIVRYYKRKAEIEKYFQVVTYIIRLLDSAKKLSEVDIEEISKYKDKLSKISKSYAGFRKGAGVVASKNPNGSLADMFLDYVRMIFHIDLIKFNSMMNTFDDKQGELNSVYEIMGMIDSIKEHSSVLITGSNASGKSTFIKTLAINAILAQTIYTVMSDEYNASFFKVASSMALQDNLYGNESYYIVEIKSLKRIIDMLEDKVPTLCFVDEVLRGTNTLERIAASSRILLSLAKGNAMCFAATHDIELTHILEKYYSNYHFQEQVVDNNILFDYVLYEGRAVSKNAIKLLSIIGYTDDITDAATESANEFLEKGEWKVIE